MVDNQHAIWGGGGGGRYLVVRGWRWWALGCVVRGSRSGRVEAERWGFDKLCCGRPGGGVWPSGLRHHLAAMGSEGKVFFFWGGGGGGGGGVERRQK